MTSDEFTDFTKRMDALRAAALAKAEATLLADDVKLTSAEAIQVLAIVTDAEQAEEPPDRTLRTSLSRPDPWRPLPGVPSKRGGSDWALLVPNMATVTDTIAGSGLALQPFQRRFLRRAFAASTGVAALSTPRGAGKTELIGRVAGLAVMEGSPLYRPGHEAVVVAGSMRQARHVFRAALRVLPHPDTIRKRDNNQEISLQGPAGTRVNIYPSSGKRLSGSGERAPAHLRRARVYERPRRCPAVGGADGLPRQAGGPAAAGVRDALPGRTRHLVAGADRDGGDARTYVQLHQAGDDEMWDDLRTAHRANPLLRINADLRAVVRVERDAAGGTPRRNPPIARGG